MLIENLVSKPMKIIRINWFIQIIHNMTGDNVAQISRNFLK